MTHSYNYLQIYFFFFLWVYLGERIQNNADIRLSLPYLTSGTISWENWWQQSLIPLCWLWWSHLTMCCSRCRSSATYRRTAETSNRSESASCRRCSLDANTSCEVDAWPPPTTATKTTTTNTSLFDTSRRVDVQTVWKHGVWSLVIVTQMITTAPSHVVLVQLVRQSSYTHLKTI